MFLLCCETEAKGKQTSLGVQIADRPFEFDPEDALVRVVAIPGGVAVREAPTEAFAGIVDDDES